MSATTSSNLKDDPEHHVTDILAAMALVGGLGGMMLRVKIGLDHTSYPQLIEAWKDRVTKMADLRHWPTSIKPDRVAIETLRYWLSNVCPECTGLKYTKHDKSPTLQSEVCPCCDGAGVMPMQFAGEIRKFAIDALEELSDIDVRVGIRVAKKLKKVD